MDLEGDTKFSNIKGPSDNLEYMMIVNKQHLELGPENIWSLVQFLYNRS